MSNRDRKAQQVIEYLLLLSAIVIGVLAFLVNQSRFRVAVHNVINMALHSVDTDEELFNFSWVETGCSCSEECGEGVLICDPQQRTCQREDGLTITTQPSPCASLPYPQTGKSCVGNNCCGNGTIDVFVGEECDVGDLGGKTCATFGYYPEDALICNDLCQIDSSRCNRCRDGILYGDPAFEPCEPVNPPDHPVAQFHGQTCASELQDNAYEGVLSCNHNCTINTDGCYKCGDGTKNPGEECDGNERGMIGECHDLDPKYYPGYGTLGDCQADCTFNPDGCMECGDDVVEGPEDCEPNLHIEADWPCEDHHNCVPGGGINYDRCNTGNLVCEQQSRPLDVRCRYNYDYCQYIPPKCVKPDNTPIPCDDPPLDSDLYEWCSMAPGPQQDYRSCLGLMHNDKEAYFYSSPLGCPDDPDITPQNKCFLYCKSPFVPNDTNTGCECPGSLIPIQGGGGQSCGCTTGYFIQHTTTCPGERCLQGASGSYCSHCDREFH